MWEKIKLNSDGVDYWKQEIKTRLWWRLWWGLAESGRNLESSGRFCVGVFGRNLALVAVKMFSRLIFFIKKFLKMFTLNAICKYNAAMNFLTELHKRFNPFNFDYASATDKT
jgi:hypothetical protein